MWDEDAAHRFGESVRARRRAAGLTQRELATHAGITKNQLQLIEAGIAASGTTRPANPRMTTVAGLSHGLGLSTTELMADAEA